MTQTRREYLVSLGLASPGRGKFSNEGKAAIAKAEADGVVFADSTPSKPVTQPTKAEPVQEGNSLYLTPDEYRFPEAEYRAVAYINGKRKEYSMRECCNLCRVSLVNHGCDAPTIHGNIVIKIEGR